jgi:hypothetical protein
METSNPQRQRVVNVVGIVAFLAVGGFWINRWTKGPAMPSDEKSFCDAVESYSKQYRAAEGNQIREEAIATQRNRDTRTGKVAGWVGTVDRIDTSLAGTVGFAVKLPCSETTIVATWNNAISDASWSTRVKESDPLYKTLSGLSKDQKVEIAGEIVKGEKGVVEMSATESGGMNAPEFLFRFTAVLPKK